MTLQRFLKWGTLTTGVICLATGYGLVGQWGLLAVAALVWLTGILAAGWSVVIFIVLVGLAAVGICVGAWPTLMISGATLALASWDRPASGQRHAGEAVERHCPTCQC